MPGEKENKLENYQKKNSTELPNKVISDINVIAKEFDIELFSS